MKLHSASELRNSVKAVIYVKGSQEGHILTVVKSWGNKGINYNLRILSIDKNYLIDKYYDINSRAIRTNDANKL